MTKQHTIHLNDYLQAVLAELQEAEQDLHAAELRAASLRGQRALLLRMMQLPVRTDGEEVPTEPAKEPMLE